MFRDLLLLPLATVEDRCFEVLSLENRRRLPVLVVISAAASVVAALLRNSSQGTESRRVKYRPRIDVSL
ncbi:hypothetical protein DM860_018202 [Cuscuta australis]|uniref:Uncharacterized protein n=1 Tax=Cuscuta australis TaxID=267555 RepID=A0A328DU53_9ASTE|nr:hypothetical protein DM860_018202 [Cuscuta australis]